MPIQDMTTPHEIFSTKALEAISPILTAIDGFTFDVSDDANAKPGDTIQAAYVSAEAVGAWNDENNNYLDGDLTKQFVDVKLDKRPKVSFALTQSDLMNFRPEFWMGKGKANGIALAHSIINTIFGVVQSATGLTTHEALPADVTTLTLDHFAELTSYLVSLQEVGQPMPVEQSNLYLAPAYFERLKILLPYSAIGSSTPLLSRMLPGVLGFNRVIEVPSLTTPGFVAQPGAVAVASRRVPLAIPQDYPLHDHFQDPVTGLWFTHTVASRRATGGAVDTLEAMLGAKIGDEKAVIKLTAI